MFWNVTFIYNAFIRTTDHCKVQTAFVSLFYIFINMKQWNASYSSVDVGRPRPLGHLTNFLRIFTIFLISENSLKFANFFAEVTNSRSMILSLFKSTCNQTRSKSLVVLNSTAGGDGAKQNRPDSTSDTQVNPSRLIEVDSQVCSLWTHWTTLQCHCYPLTVAVFTSFQVSLNLCRSRAFPVWPAWSFMAKPSPWRYRLLPICSGKLSLLQAARGL